MRGKGEEGRGEGENACTLGSAVGCLRWSEQWSVEEENLLRFGVSEITRENQGSSANAPAPVGSGSSEPGVKQPNLSSFTSPIA